MFNRHKTNDYKNTLLHILNNYQRTQSWLLYGGPTKKELVFSFANRLLGTDDIDHPDLLYLQQDNILVDDIRSLNNFLYKTSFDNNYRIAIIDSISNMNANAMHAILKILEEPPAKTVIVLMNENLHNVLPTIRSRCYKLYVTDKYDSHHLNITLYQEVLEYFKHSKSPNISDQKSFEEILSLLQLLILRIIKIKSIESPIAELYEGEILDLQSFNICITSLYKRWEEILNLSINKLHLSKQQIVILLFESK